MLDITDLYRENDYLKLYPDVAIAVQQGNFVSGWEHFQEFGQDEARNPGAFFNESYYLELYPDVAVAVAAGTFSSGLDHYLTSGQFEARESTPLFSEQLYRQANGDVVAAIDSLTGSLVNCLQHFITFGDSEGRDAHARTVILWDEAAQQAVLNTRAGPTIASRAYGMVHTAIFDAWAAYDPQAQGTQFNLQLPTEVNTLLNKSEAISYAAYQTLVDLFPTQVELFNGVMAKLGYSLENIPTDINSPSGIGMASADALLNYRHQDGSNQLNQYADTTGYQPVNTPDAIIDPNFWQPLRSPFNDPNGTVQKYLTPHWGTIIPFALESGDQFRPPAPAPFGSLEYEQQAADVLNLSGNLTDEQKIIAEFWEDGPGTSFPPGKWMTFGQFVSQRDAHTLDQDVQLFFLLGNAVMDAGIAAWDAKGAYDYVRPITAIRLLYEGVPVSAWGGVGQGTQTIDGGDWLPYQSINSITPPFAEYVSGHSTFSAAAAEVLKRFTGSDIFGASFIQAAGTSRFEPGITPQTDISLSWQTFSEAADEAGSSRLYGGIHFEDGDLEGRKLGRQVGEEVWNRFQSLIRV